MSSIPNSAMPHTYAHDDEDDGSRKHEGLSTGLLVAGAAVAAYLVYKALR